MPTSEHTTASGDVSSACGLYLEQRDLHERIRTGDKLALLECLDRFGHIVYCTLLGVTGDTALTEELTERAFVSLWRSPAVFDPGRGPIAFQLLRALSSSLDLHRPPPTITPSRAGPTPPSPRRLPRIPSWPTPGSPPTTP